MNFFLLLVGGHSEIYFLHLHPLHFQMLWKFMKDHPDAGRDAYISLFPDVVAGFSSLDTLCTDLYNFD